MVSSELNICLEWWLRLNIEWNIVNSNMHNVHNSKAFQHGMERYFNPFKRKLIVCSREVPWTVWVHYFNVFFQKWLHTDSSGFLFTFGVYGPLTRVNYLIYTAGVPACIPWTPKIPMSLLPCTFHTHSAEWGRKSHPLPAPHAAHMSLVTV